MALLAFGSVGPGADVAVDAVTVAGNVTKARTWTAVQIKAELAKEAKTIKYTAKTDSHAALAVPLLALVNAAEPKLDPKIKNHALRFVVVVEGKDGYIAMFTLSELMPDIGNREVWVGLDMDDKPLSARDTPASLLVPGDKNQERWVHGIKAIRMVDMGLMPKD